MSYAKMQRPEVLKNNHFENIKCESLLENYLERLCGNKDVNTKNIQRIIYTLKREAIFFLVLKIITTILVPSLLHHLC